MGRTCREVCISERKGRERERGGGPRNQWVVHPMIVCQENEVTPKGPIHVKKNKVTTIAPGHFSMWRSIEGISVQRKRELRLNMMSDKLLSSL